MANKRKRNHRKASSSLARRRRMLCTVQASDEENDNDPEAPFLPMPNLPSTPSRATQPLIDVTNSPAVLTCQKPDRIFTSSAHKRKRNQAVTPRPSLTTPQKPVTADAGQSTCRHVGKKALCVSKRLRLDAQAEETSDVEWIPDYESDSEVELNVEFDPSSDGLDMIQCRNIVSLPHVLRQHAQIVDHSRTCTRTSGRMRLDGVPVHAGLYTVLRYKCDACGAKATLDTDPAGKTLNTALAWGALSIGVGQYQVEELFATLNVATPSPNYFRKCESEVGRVWKDAFEKIRLKNIEEEKKHCEESEGKKVGTGRVDGVWSKRCYGHGFNAKSGAACIIGAHTNSLLYVGVENKYCKVCSWAAWQGKEPRPHQCNATYSGPSTGMESSLIIKGMKSLFHKDDIWIKNIIGDGDSSVFSNIKRLAPRGRHCVKIECPNHMTRCYTSKLHGLAKNKAIDVKGRHILTPRIPRLTSAARGAIRANARGDVEQLRRDLHNGPMHVFGDHNECSDSYCRRQDMNEPNWTNPADNFGVLDKVYEALTPMYIDAPKLILNETTNLCESFMSKISKTTGGKRIDFTTGPSFGIRVIGAALLFSLGPAFHLQVWQEWQGSSMGAVAEMVFSRRVTKVQRKRAARQREQERRMAGEWVPRRRSQPAPADAHYGATNERKLQEAPDVSDQELEQRMAAKLQELQDRVPDEQATRDIEERTRGQADNAYWHEIRDDMLPGSWHGRVVNMRPTTLRGNAVKALYLKKPLDGLAHIMEGRIAEGVALRAYEARYGVKVQESGTYIRHDLPYMNSSNDGNVEEDGCTEVKHFSTLGDQTILEAFSDPKSRKKLRGYLTTEKQEITTFKRVKGKMQKVVEVKTVVVPNRRSPVYVQIQSELNLGKKKWCDFILHCNSDWQVFRIEKDERFYNSKCIPCEPQHVVDARRAAGLPMPFDTPDLEEEDEEEQEG